MDISNGKDDLDTNFTVIKTSPNQKLAHYDNYVFT